MALSTSAIAFAQGLQWARENVLPVVASGIVGGQAIQMFRDGNYGGLIGSIGGAGYELGKDVANNNLSIETFFRAALAATIGRAAGEVIQRGIENPSTILPTLGGAGGGALVGYVGTLFMAPDMTVAQSAEVVGLGAVLGSTTVSDGIDDRAFEEIGTAGGAIIPFLLNAVEGKQIDHTTFEAATKASMFIRALFAFIFSSQSGELNVLRNAFSGGVGQVEQQMRPAAAPRAIQLNEAIHYEDEDGELDDYEDELDG